MEVEATIDGTPGILAMEVGPFGQTKVLFRTERMLVQTDSAEDNLTDWTADLADGRRVTMHRCYPTRVCFSLGANAGKGCSTSLLPAGGITIERPASHYSTAEFALANLWLPAIAPLKFDALDVEFVPAAWGGPHYVDLPKGSEARVVWWMRVQLGGTTRIEEAYEAALCFSDLASLFLDERVRVPAYRVLDAEGNEVLSHLNSIRWPVITKRGRDYTDRVQDALLAVGAAPVRAEFEGLHLHRYVDTVLEAWREDVFLETSLACILMALEGITYRWEITKGGMSPEEAQKRNLVEKLRFMNTSLQFIDKRYMSDPLREDLRNPIVHTGAVPSMTAQELHRWVDDLVLLARDVFFRVLGFSRTFVGTSTP
jgi:hypothetical protein